MVNKTSRPSTAESNSHSDRHEAASHPPHLAGIMVQNAFTDMYRDVAFKGGVLHPNLLEGMNEIYLAHGNAENSRVLSLKEACERYPFYNEFWEEYRANVEEITCPLYMITSFADNGIHTPESIRG